MTSSIVVNKEIIKTVLSLSLTLSLPPCLSPLFLSFLSFFLFLSLSLLSLSLSLSLHLQSTFSLIPHSSHLGVKESMDTARAAAAKAIGTTNILEKVKVENLRSNTLRPFFALVWCCLPLFS